MGLRRDDEANLALDFAIGPEPGHVIESDEYRARPRPRGDDRWILDERIAGEQRRLETGWDLKWREAFFGGRAGARWLAGLE